METEMDSKVLHPLIHRKNQKGEMKKYKLSDIFLFSKGQGLSWKDIDDNNGMNPCILYGNLYTDYLTIINEINHNTNMSKNGLVLSEMDDILIPASDTTPTGLARAWCLRKNGVLLGGDINILRLLNSLKFNGVFLTYCINSHRSELLKIIQGSTVRHIHNGDIKDIEITIPSDVTEQNFIGALLSSLDDVILQTMKKVNTLKHLKQTMLEKMFPKNGADVPEIRFEGFDGEWSISKFSDSFATLTNNSLTRAELDDTTGEYLNIHYGDILIKYPEILSVCEVNLPHISPNVNYSIQSKAMLLKDGDIILADAAEDTTVGKAIEVQNVKDNKLVSGLHTIPCRPIIKCAPGYLGYYINSNLYHDQLLPLIQGSKVSSISKSAIGDTTIYFPKDIREQKMIVAVFNSISKQIETNKELLLKFQSLKKALLERMFVS